MPNESLLQSPAAAYQTALRAEFSRRSAAHIAEIERIRTTFVAGPAPVVLLANGDSWFDYPVDNTDIVHQLNGLLGLRQPPKIYSVAVAGNTTLESMGLERQQAIWQAINEPYKYGKFEGILYSGGGDDIAGDAFWMWLNGAANAGPAASDCLNDRFEACIALVIKSYEALVSQRDRLLHGVPIFTHVYDFAIPDGAKVHCGPLTFGPWMKPGFDYQGYPAPSPTQLRTTQVVEAAIRRFDKALRAWGGKQDKFFVVDTWRAVPPDGWANELHPKPPGFAALANRFLDAMKLWPPFRGRIG